MLFGSNISKTLSVEQFNVNVNWNESVGSFILSNYRDRAVVKNRLYLSSLSCGHISKADFALQIIRLKNKQLYSSQ